MKISIGSKLKMARTKKGLKQVDVCKLLDMPASTLSNYERDEREPDLTTLSRLAELYETPIDYFLDINEAKKEMGAFSQNWESIYDNFSRDHATRYNRL